LFVFRQLNFKGRTSGHPTWGGHVEHFSVVLDLKEVPRRHSTRHLNLDGVIVAAADSASRGRRHGLRGGNKEVGWDAQERVEVGADPRNGVGSRDGRRHPLLKLHAPLVLRVVFEAEQRTKRFFARKGAAKANKYKIM
jgi:hypothetical protein